MRLEQMWKCVVVVALAVVPWFGVAQVAAEEPADEPAEVPPAVITKEVEAVPRITVIGQDGEETPEMTDEMRKQIEEAIKEARERAEAERRELQERLAADPAWQGTHKQAAVIRVSTDENPVRLNNFCLNRDGNLLAACGSAIRYSMGGLVPAASAQTNGIRVYSPEGELLETWPLDFTPEAVCVHTDGTIFVGGDGHLARLAADGTVMATGDTPVITSLQPDPIEEEVDEEEETDEGEEADADDAEEDGAAAAGVEEECDQEKAETSSILRGLIRSVLGSDDSDADTEVEVDASRAEMMAQRARTVTGIAITDQDLFVACPMTKGYGYAIWRCDHDFTNGVQIVDGLRGCCGQMDIQAHDGNVWVPENGRHRVICYDREGEIVTRFGSRDRKEASGFGGCCEPKNLRFDAEGVIYTAESGPPVAVKRFSTDGEFLGVVAVPEYETGCVRVTVDVSADGQRVFILSPNENAIYVLEDKRYVATHEEIDSITIPTGDEPAEIHSFCLAADGRLLATCGGTRLAYERTDAGYEMKEITEPAGIRVLSPEGEEITTWQLDVTPQAINVAPDGTIFAGGQGRLVKLDAEGKVLATADAPQIAKLGPLPELPEEEEEEEETPEEAEAKKKLLEELAEKQQAALATYNEGRQELEAAGADQKAVAAANEKIREALTQYSQISQERRELTMTARTIALQQRSAAMRKRAVTGIAATKQDLFVACPAVEGYGYCVWRMDHDLGNPVRIADGLRGCCGQLDIQAYDGDVYVAENSRMRVVRYDRDGEEISSWGKKARKDIVGFGSCCNPMNLRFGADGNVYTSEASVGRIKRFTPDGEFLGLVGVAEIVPGCKHVAIGVSEDGSRVYLLDITRKRIAVMTASEGPAEEDEAPGPEAEAAAEVEGEVRIGGFF